MIQIRMQQGLSQDGRIIRQEVFVEEQGFHHEFDETDQAHGIWCYMKMGMPLAAAGSLHQTIRVCIYWAAWPYGNPAAADSTGSAWYRERKDGCAAFA